MNDAAKTNDEKAFQHNAMTSFIQIAALVFLVGFCIQIFAPFTGLVTWGLIIAVAVYPLHLRLAAGLGNSQKLSAILFVLIGLAILVLPTWITAESSIASAKSLATDLKDGAISISPPADTVAEWPVIGKRVYAIWSGAAADLEATINQFKPQMVQASEWVLRTIGGVALGVLQFAVSIIIAGVFLVYGASGYKFSCTLASRIAGERGQHLTDLSVATIRSVTKGVLGVAFIQAVLAAIGLIVLGVPAAGIWAAIVLVTAIVQIPTLLIMGPIAAWVFSMADPIPATIFAIYALLVSLSDNFLKPLLLGRGVDLPMLVILVGAIGGAIYAGVIGLFIGAVVLALGYTIIMDWIARDSANETLADGEQAD